MTAREVNEDGALGPLYLAGFTTAFGAHGLAAALGAEAGDLGLNLLAFGVILALYDVAEVILKPIFGSLSDRIGVKPVIVGGLCVFAAVSVLGIFAASPVLLALARLGQGAAASAFSPASSAAVARLAGKGKIGSYFGRYGSWKSLGYAAGPLFGAVLMTIGGLPAVFAALAVLSVIAAWWSSAKIPALPVLPRPRYTIADVLRQSTHRSFLVPTIVLAAATGALGVASGFLPLLGTTAGMAPFGAMATVTVLALASTLVQPYVGRLRDAARLSTRPGTALGLAAAAAGLALTAAAPVPAALYVAAALVGAGIGTATPLAFAHLAASTPAERLGRTMGSAELGREAGDAGGPILVGGIAAAASVSAGLFAVAALTLAAAILGATALRKNSDLQPAGDSEP